MDKTYKHTHCTCIYTWSRVILDKTNKHTYCTCIYTWSGVILDKTNKHTHCTCIYTWSGVILDKTNKQTYILYMYLHMISCHLSMFDYGMKLKLFRVLSIDMWYWILKPHQSVNRSNETTKFCIQFLNDV